MMRETVQKTLDYVDANVKEDISAETLAEIAGYSVFHFYRLFQSAVGIPVMQYVLRRKLLFAICEIGSGRKKNEVVYEYGFETYSGFYRAFVREIGYTPAQYLRDFKAKKPFRINIFQEEHIMVSNKVISEVLADWGLQGEKTADIVFPETGEISDTAKYVGSDKVIKYTANLGKVKKAIEISKALENVGLNAPSVIPTLDGKEYVQKGELFFTLTQKVEGERVMASGLYLEDYKDKARFIGEIVGQLDMALSKADALVEEADLARSVCAWAVPALTGKIDLSTEFMADFAEQFKAMYKELPRRIIHRDPNPSNIILAEDKWGFIDFELSERNARIFDPCYAATAILSETFEAGNEEKLLTWTEVMKEIMYGYDSVVKMTDAEKKAVPFMILANQLVSTAFFAGKDKYEEIYKTNKAMTEWIAGNLDKLTVL
ncbi:MAG: helix-turn-helix domain-containing protein [Lachnospiraceae bacterium]|nr:helix-turn-helix domain-containing protein [Lachnospiraceae bacterium]